MKKDMTTDQMVKLADRLSKIDNFDLSQVFALLQRQIKSDFDDLIASQISDASMCAYFEGMDSGDIANMLPRDFFDNLNYSELNAGAIFDHMCSEQSIDDVISFHGPEFMEEMIAKWKRVHRV